MRRERTARYRPGCEALEGKGESWLPVVWVAKRHTDLSFMSADNQGAEVDNVHAFTRLVLNSEENIPDLNAAAQLRAAACSDGLDSDAAVAEGRK